jgi:hypothetical protein
MGDDECRGIANGHDWVSDGPMDVVCDICDLHGRVSVKVLPHRG